MANLKVAAAASPYWCIAIVNMRQAKEDICIGIEHLLTDNIAFCSTREQAVIIQQNIEAIHFAQMHRAQESLLLPDV